MRFIFAACLGVSLSVCHFTDAVADPQLPGDPNGGNVTVSGSMINALDPYTNTSSGSIEILGGATLTNEVGATLTNEGGGVIQNNGGVIVNHGNFLNTGLVTSATFDNRGQLSNTNTFTNNLLFTNYSGGTFSNDGTFNSTGTFNNSGTIHGTGSMTGTINDAGMMAPGNSIESPANLTGVISIDGEWNKTAGFTKIELAGESDGGGDKALTEFDWLEVNGNVNLNSSLQVILVDAFALTEGMSFDIVRVGGSLSGEFDGLPEGALVGTFSSRDLYVTYAGGDGNDISLYTTGVPEPASLLLALLGLAVLPRRRRR